MEKSQMKNIIVLKNLPSNLIEEAIMIVKSTKLAKKAEYIDKIETKTIEKNTHDDNYIAKEAESIISNYIKEVEAKQEKESTIHTIKRYKTLKIYSIIITIGFILLAILH